MICCGSFEPFILWQAAWYQPELKNKALVSTANNRLRAVSKLAAEQGLVEGMSVQAAKASCPDLFIVESTELAAVWTEIVNQLYGFSNKIETKRIGLVFIELKQSEARQMAEVFDIEIACEASQEQALLKVLKQANRDIFRALGLSKNNIERLNWLGIKKLEQLKSWSKNQLELYLAEEAKLIAPYLSGKYKKDIAIYKPESSLIANYYFDDAVLEPMRIEPALKLLAEQLERQLAKKAARSLRISSKALGLSFSASRASKIILQKKETIYRLAKQLFSESGVEGLAVDEIKLELSAIYQLEHQTGLWPAKENKSKAIEIVEARFPSSLKYFEEIDSYIPVSEFAYLLKAFNESEVKHENFGIRSPKPKGITSPSRRSKSLIYY